MPDTCSSSMHCCAKSCQLVTAQQRPASPFLLQGASTHTPVHVIVLSILTRREEEEEEEEEEEGLLVLSHQSRYYRSARKYS